MQSSTAAEVPRGGGIEALAPLPMAAAADLQGHLMIANHDLERLHALLGDACAALLAGFHGAAEALRRDEGAGEAATAAASSDALAALGGAVTALQFHDLASQLIAHTSQRLRHCAERLGRDAFCGADDADEDAALVAEAPLRPNPVTQAEMDAGSVELF
jgi:hypothetical protein